MAVTGDLGGQPITLNNAAEEFTLQAINNNLSQLGKAAGYNLTGLRNANATAGKAAGALKTVANAAGMSASAMENSVAAVQRWSNEASKNMRAASASMGRALSTSGDTLSSRLTAVGGAFSSAVKSIPLLGSVAGVAAGAITGHIANMVDAFDTAQKSGASFGYDIGKFGEIAGQSGLTFGQLAEVANKAGEGLSKFGGTTLRGSQDFARFSNGLRQSNFSKDLMRMGMSITDQAIAMADYTGMLARQGVKIDQLNTNDVVIGMASYQRELKTLSQMTGTTIDQQRQLQKQEMMNADSRAAIMTLNKDQQQIALQSITTATEKFGPAAGQVIRELIAHGQVVSKEGLMFADQNQAAFGHLQGLTTNLRAGAASADGVSQMFANMEKDDRIQSEMQQNAKLAAQMVGVAHSNAYINTIKDSLPKIADTVGQFRNEGVAKIREDMARLSDDVSGMQKITNELRNFGQAAQTALEQGTVALTNSGASNEILGDIANKTAGLTSALQTFTTELSSSTGTFETAVEKFAQAVGIGGKSQPTRRIEKAGKFISDWFKSNFLGSDQSNPAGSAARGGVGTGSQMPGSDQSEEDGSAARGGIINAPMSGAVGKIKFHGMEVIKPVANLEEAKAELSNKNTFGDANQEVLQDLRVLAQSIKAGTDKNLNEQNTGNNDLLYALKENNELLKIMTQTIEDGNKKIERAVA